MPDGTFVHMLWTCPTLQIYWAGVHTMILTITGLMGLTTWETSALGIFLHHQQKNIETRFAILALILAKHHIPLPFTYKYADCSMEGGSREMGSRRKRCNQTGGGTQNETPPHIHGVVNATSQFSNRYKTPLQKSQQLLRQCQVPQHPTRAGPTPPPTSNGTPCLSRRESYTWCYLD